MYVLYRTLMDYYYSAFLMSTSVQHPTVCTSSSEFQFLHLPDTGIKSMISELHSQFCCEFCVSHTIHKFTLFLASSVSWGKRL